jgi:hypothetical protein
MRADKNFSEKTRLSPKITIEGSHTNLLRLHSHNGPTNPRNKPKLKAKRKHNSRTTRENLQVLNGPSVRGVQTVRQLHTDCP